MTNMSEGGVDDLVQSDDVRVRAHLQDVDLSPHLLSHLQVLDLALVQDLHSHLQASHDVVCQFYFTERADAQRLAEPILS
eukprot:CAMPEP_0173349030 /NCGR_PEP_ID=MMETSP1144-20121109/14078_1 /TAXON_ID=483371 /ORGANISM="non described non described, Strain CCMP2298" /LENGTH=79 /DNA_ID=CAMNT_0014296773 /DNA_START=1743 /DNA_END=1981 /DNA_ORIENTATION=+